MEASQKQLKSVQSTDEVYVRFINSTIYNVAIAWINYTGEFVCYEVIPRGNYVHINTYKTHPWIAINIEYKERMLIDKELVYQPITCKEYFARHYPGRELPQDCAYRIPARITQPVYTLRTRVLVQLLKFFGDPIEVNGLPLPREIIKDLKRMIRNRNNLTLLRL